MCAAPRSDCGSRRVAWECPVVGQVAWRLWGRAAAARPRSRFLSHGLYHAPIDPPRHSAGSGIVISCPVDGRQGGNARQLTSCQRARTCLRRYRAPVGLRPLGNQARRPVWLLRRQMRTCDGGITHARICQPCRVFFYQPSPHRRSRAGDMDCSARVYT